jgi:alkylation response protein AidB-like acyl-CoA dehydrogenase
VRVLDAIREFGALPPPGGLGMSPGAETIIARATDEQKRRYVFDIVSGQRSWCQLFSEPGAGSDLAGLSTRAELDGDEWVVNGQKVWTSSGHWADFGMLLARTDPDVPKHQGITFFACDMHQPGVDVRPLRELTGRALFNEVFLTDVRVPTDAAIGGVNNGWSVANTALMFERSGLGAGGGHAGVTARPGTVAADLSRPVSEFLHTQVIVGGGEGNPMSVENLSALARRNGRVDDAGIREGLAELYTLHEIARYTNLRQRALQGVGSEIAGLGNLSKLAMSRILRLHRDLAGRILGPYAALHGYDHDSITALEEASGGRVEPSVTEAMLFAQAPQIYGGTDEIQHNIVAERVLGLPKEPDANKGKPFRDLPKNG